jgi:methionine-rich copper-binding protein CopC
LARSLPRAASVAALLLMLFVGPALAHAAFVSGTPGPGDEVAGSPVGLVIEFSQNLDPSRTSLEVRDASGASLARGGEVGQGPREFRLALPELPRGEYEVRWTTFSAEDSELARGSYTFTIVAVPSFSPSLSPSLSPSSSPSPIPSSTASPAATPLPATPAPSPSVLEPTGDTPANSDGAVVLPIVAALLVVVGIGVWLVRRRAT